MSCATRVQAPRPWSSPTETASCGFRSTMTAGAPACYLTTEMAAGCRDARAGGGTGRSVRRRAAARWRVPRPGPSPDQERMMIRVLLADDQALVRAGFRALLDAQEGIEVIEEANDGREAVQLAKKLRPDVILMDIRMPVLDGLAATREIA